MPGKLSRIGAVLMFNAVAGAIWPAGEPQPAAERPIELHSSQQYNSLRKSASTVLELKALAEYCRGQASACASHAARLKEELAEYYEGRGPRSKAARRGQTLKDLIAHYQDLAAKWQTRATDYNDRMVRLDVARAKQ